MNGFCAIYTQDAAIDCDLLQRMMAHRGDTCECWTYQGVGLAVKSDQKPRNAWQIEHCPITADARLDYRSDLVKLLGTLSVENSDAQLIVAAYERWGEQCVSYLEGDYAFVLWDNKRQLLLAARSVGGLRPFVYYVGSHHLLFASEPMQLFEDPAVSHELNPTWTTFWLSRGQGHWCGTIYRDIQTLVPGHTMIVDRSGIRVQPFWQPPRQSHEMTQTGCIEHFRTLLIDAVRTRLWGERRLFFDLSGGLDSSSLVCLASLLWDQAEKDYPLDCFYAASDESLPYVHALTAQYPAVNLYTLCWPEHLHFDGAFDPAPWTSYPCRPTSILASFYRKQWELAAKLGAGAHIRGDFGDELLGATPGYLHQLWKERRFATLVREIKRWKHAELSLRALLERWVIQPHLCNLYNLYSPPTVSLPWVRSTVLQQSRTREEQDDAYFYRLAPDPFRRELVRWLWFHTDYTIQADIALKMAGVETREPYTDLRLITFLLSIPPQYQIRPGERKFLLREAMGEVLPEQVRRRQGKGHAYRFFFQGIKKHHEKLYQMILHMPDFLSPYIDPVALLRTLDHVALGGQVNVPALSSVLALVLWAHRVPWSHSPIYENYQSD